LEENKKTPKEISKLTGVPVDTIYGIRTKGLWSSISKKYKIPKFGYTEKQIRKVCKLLQENKISCGKISMKTSVDRITISNILRHKSWTKISSEYNFTDRILSYNKT
jgi:hypothetical protein